MPQPCVCLPLNLLPTSLSKYLLHTAVAFQWHALSLSAAEPFQAGVQAFLDGIGHAVAAQLSAAQMCEALAQLPTSGIPEPVSRAATELLQREAASRVK